MSTDLVPRGRKKEPLTVRFTPALLRRARALAQKRNVTLNSVVEVSCERGLSELEKA